MSHKTRRTNSEKEPTNKFARALANKSGGNYIRSDILGGILSGMDEMQREMAVLFMRAILVPGNNDTNKTNRDVTHMQLMLQTHFVQNYCIVTMLKSLINETLLSATPLSSGDAVGNLLGLMTSLSDDPQKGGAPLVGHIKRITKVILCILMMFSSGSVEQLDIKSSPVHSFDKTAQHVVDVSPLINTRDSARTIYNSITNVFSSVPKSGTAELNEIVAEFNVEMHNIFENIQTTCVDIINGAYPIQPPKSQPTNELYIVSPETAQALETIFHRGVVEIFGLKTNNMQLLSKPQSDDHGDAMMARLKICDSMSLSIEHSESKLYIRGGYVDKDSIIEFLNRVNADNDRITDPIEKQSIIERIMVLQDIVDKLSTTSDSIYNTINTVAQNAQPTSFNKINDLLRKTQHNFGMLSTELSSDFPIQTRKINKKKRMNNSLMNIEDELSNIRSEMFTHKIDNSLPVQTIKFWSDYSLRSLQYTNYFTQNMTQEFGNGILGIQNELINLGDKSLKNFLSSFTGMMCIGMLVFLTILLSNIVMFTWASFRFVVIIINGVFFIYRVISKPFRISFQYIGTIIPPRRRTEQIRGGMSRRRRRRNRSMRRHTHKKNKQ